MLREIVPNATVTLASQLHAFAPVWLGSTVGMVVADGVAIWLGKLVRHQLPERAIRVAAAAVFILSGLVTIVDTLGAARL
jgi:putative Ca2+/H+ antiporter (TMEM165/GDT1 family)